MSTPAPQALLLRFEVQCPDAAHIIDTWVKTPALEKVLSSPKQLDRFMEDLCEALGVPFRSALDQRLLLGVPLVNAHPLWGQWLCASPVGMEDTQPAPAWQFEERKALVLQDPVAYPLVEGDLAGKDERPLSQWESAITHALHATLGQDTLQSISSVPVRNWLDDAISF